MKRHLLSVFLGILISCQSRPGGETLAIPEELPTFDVHSTMPGEAFPGYIQVRKITDPGAQIIFDSKGEIKWYQLSDTALFRPFTPSTDRYLALHDDRQIFEITYSGDTLFALKYGENGFDKTVHHEVIYVGDHIAALTKEKHPIDLSAIGGQAADSIITDGILILDRKGNKIWSWSITDVINPLEDPEVLKYKSDWGHANSLDVDDDGHFLISWRNFNEVWKINKNSGEIIWRYGHEQMADSSEYFYGQHAFHRIEGGMYLLFDNGDKKTRGFSRALGFTHSEGDRFKQVLSIPLPDSLFTSKQGSVYKIADDRFLFSSSMSSSIVLTNQSGDIVWYAKSTEPYYRAYYLNNIDL